MKFSLPARLLTTLTCLGLLSIHNPVAAGQKPADKVSKTAKSGESTSGKSDGAKSPRNRAAEAGSGRAGNGAGMAASRATGKTTATRQGSRATRTVVSRPSQYRLVKKGGKVIRVAYAPRVVVPTRPSIGKVIGLREVDDPLDLSSSVAVVVDDRSNEVLFEKNPGAVLPIASITKLMTAMVTLDLRQDMGEMLEITDADNDTEKFSRSRLRAGSRLTRAEMMQLALMASENRAANALGRHHPGGLSSFVAAMNAKARSLGMLNTRFQDPTGLSSSNVSSGQDLVKLVQAAATYPTIRQFSTASELTVDTGYRQFTFRNTNRLIDGSDWQIAVSKTGYISEAGNCLVMHALIEGRPMVLVLLDGERRSTRYGDAQRLRQWLETATVKARNQPPREPPRQAAPVHARVL